MTLAIVPVDVKPATTDTAAQLRKVKGAEAINQGDPVYEDSATNKWKIGDWDSAEAAAVTAIAMSKCGADGDSFIIMTAGDIDPGVDMTVGETYVVGNAGDWEPIGDLAAGKFSTHIGQATAARVLPLNFNASGVAKA